MRYIIYILCLLIIGCTSGIDADEVAHSEGNNYATVTVDSCEYLEYDYGVFDQRVYSITHKGNCKYCAQRAINQQQNK